MGDPDDGEMIGMTNNEVKKYAAVEETNGRINTHIINQEQVRRSMAVFVIFLIKIASSFLWAILLHALKLIIITGFISHC
jgi:uncharacterized membrane protein